VLKATLLKDKPKTLFETSKPKKGIKVEDIKEAIEKLDLKYKRVDEIDIFNILSLLKEQK